MQMIIKDLGDALLLARDKYPTDKYEHSLRVMYNVLENKMLTRELRDKCAIIAVLHDIIEDTDLQLDEVCFCYGNVSGNNPDMWEALMLLTHDKKEQNYTDYVANITEVNDTAAGKLAWWVKLADMHDHLVQTSTLTDKLKEKYLCALPHLI